MGSFSRLATHVSPVITETMSQMSQAANIHLHLPCRHKTLSQLSQPTTLRHFPRQAGMVIDTIDFPLLFTYPLLLPKAIKMNLNAAIPAHRKKIAHHSRHDLNYSACSTRYIYYSCYTHYSHYSEPSSLKLSFLPHSKTEKNKNSIHVSNVPTHQPGKDAGPVACLKCPNPCPCE